MIGDQLRLRVKLGCWPDFSNSSLPYIENSTDDYPHHLEFRPHPADLHRFAAEVDAEAARFPVRFIEPDGIARRQRAKLDLAVTPFNLRFTADVVRSADGTPITVWRTGTGPPVVVVAHSHYDWAEVAPQLAEEFTVALLDPRGRAGGASGPRRSGHTMQRDIEDIVAVVTAQQQRVILLAEEYGALCALEAVRLTSQVAVLVLYAPPLTVTTSELDLVKRAEANIGPIPRGDVLRLRAPYHFDPTRFARIPVASLLLVGERSPTERRAESAAIHQVLPYSRLVELGGGIRGIGPWAAQGDQVVQALREFVAATAPNTSRE